MTRSTTPKIKKEGRMGNVNFKDVAIRAVKTAVAAFVAVVPATAIVGGDVASIKNGLIVAGSAVVSYVWNLAIQYSSS
jgi:hypothetical protein